MRKYILWIVGPLMLVLLYQIIFRRGRRRRTANAVRDDALALVWPGLDSEFYQLERRLAARGIPRQPGEAMTDWIERLLVESSLVGLRAPLQDLLQLHYRHRFDPNGLRREEREMLAQKVKDLLRILSEK